MQVWHSYTDVTQMMHTIQVITSTYQKVEEEGRLKRELFALCLLELKVLQQLKLL